MTAEETPVWFHHQAPVLLKAYEGIFFRCGEEAYLIRFPPRPPTAKKVLLHREKTRTALEHIVELGP